MQKQEFTYSDEQTAKTNRRSLINSGWQVSLIAYDGSRNVYVFDAWK